MDEPATIRVAEASDVPAVLRIYSQPAVDAGEVLSKEAAAALLERFSRYPSYSLYVACVEGEVVGTFALMVMDNLGHLGKPSAIVEDVAVEPRYQRRGIGGQMMRFAMQKAAELGCYKLTLSAAKHRVNAHKFYESLGFEQHGYSFIIQPNQRET
jgi:GNAT superfamily N-acetyltransferase